MDGGESISEQHSPSSSSPFFLWISKLKVLSPILISLSLSTIFCAYFIKKIAEVFDPPQVYSLIQSEASWNRRSLVETPPLPGKGPAVGASPPSPDLALAGSTKPVPAPETQTPVGGDGTPSPPPSSVRTAQTPNPPSDPPQLLSPPPHPPPRTKKTPVSMIVGIVVGVFTVSVALIIFFLIHTRKIPIKPWTNNSGQLQDALITGNPTHTLHSSLFILWLYSFALPQMFLGCSCQSYKQHVKISVTSLALSQTAPSIKGLYPLVLKLLLSPSRMALVQTGLTIWKHSCCKRYQKNLVYALFFEHWKKMIRLRFCRFVS